MRRRTACDTLNSYLLSVITTTAEDLVENRLFMICDPGLLFRRLYLFLLFDQDKMLISYYLLHSLMGKPCQVHLSCKNMSIIILFRSSGVVGGE